MNLLDVKDKLGIPKFNLNRATTQSGEPTDWFRHWDNDTRTNISIHQDLVKELKEKGNSVENLGIQTEERNGEQGAYTSHRIVKYDPADIVL